MYRVTSLIRNRVWGVGVYAEHGAAVSEDRALAVRCPVPLALAPALRMEEEG